MAFFIRVFSFLLFTLLFIPGAAYAQIQQAIDSMINLVNRMPDDTNKVLLLDEISFSYTSLDAVKGKEYGNQVIKLSQKLNWGKGIAKGYNLLALNEMSAGRYTPALDYLFTLLKILDKQDRKSFGIAYSNIGNIYYFQEQLESSLKYYLLSLEEYKHIDSKKNMSVALGNIGLVYTKTGKLEEALRYHNQALELNKQLNDKAGIARNIGNIGRVYAEQKKFHKAIEMFTEALKLKEESGEKYGIAINHGNLGELYLAMCNEEKAGTGKINQQLIQKAVFHLEKCTALFKETGMMDNYQKNLLSLSQAYALSGDYQRAYQSHVRHIEQRDSIFNIVKKNELTKLELQYDFDRKADSLRFRNELTAVELQRQLLLSRQQKQELQLIEKDRELQQLLSFQRLSALQDERRANDENEKKLDIANKEKELQKSRIASLDKDNYLNSLRLRQQWFFSLGSIILLGGLGSFFIYRYNLKQANLQTEIAREKAEFETKMSNMTLSSLRSQMNPHFIFNCLNSIRLFAAKNDSLSATNYISKFSRLMRLVLENSKSERITLQQEIETLQLYIDMELMRFKNKLKYDMHFQNGLDTQFIEVPPMLVQPYVENAIWHGLMNKEHGGKLEIDFTEEDDTLVVKVKDNGIGREKAAALKKNLFSHKSLGLNITSERLALMNEKYGTDASVEIIDLYENDLPTGTQVIIKIPIL